MYIVYFIITIYYILTLDHYKWWILN